jgi:hypothetical protein
MTSGGLMKKVFLAGVAALFLATGTAHATDIYSIRCANQLFTIYGHHGYEFTRGETRCGKLLPEHLFRQRRDGTWFFRGHKCKYVRDTYLEAMKENCPEDIEK